MDRVDTGEDRPKYTIKTAARMTGLSAATLRAWEKRYGIPAPARAPSRYRFYSDEDVREIHWVKARVEEGIPPRQAARLAIERRQTGVPPDSGTLLDPLALVADLKAACLAHDEDGAYRVIRRAGPILRPHEILRGVLLPVIAEIGREWEAGLATVAQEHFASQLARHFAHRVMDLYQPRSDIPPVLCACAPGELHELGLMTVAVEIRRRAHPVVYLGQDVPVESVLSTLNSLGGRLAVVSVTLTEHLALWLDAQDEVARALGRMGATVLWGGPAAPSAGHRGLPGPVATTIDEAVEAVVSRTEAFR